MRKTEVGLQQNGEQKETAEKACVVKMSLELTIICVERESEDLTSEPCFLYFPAQLGGEKRERECNVNCQLGGAAGTSLRCVYTHTFTVTKHNIIIMPFCINYYAIARQHGCNCNWIYQPNQPVSGYKKTAVASLNLS